MKIYIQKVSELTGDELAQQEMGLWQERKERLSRIKPEMDKKRCIAAGALLQKAWAEAEPDRAFPKVRCTDMGKPYFASEPYFFNLTHSGDYVACAFGRWEMGLDIQQIGDMKPEFVSRFFTMQEQAYAEQAGDVAEYQYRCHEIWSRKESWGKLLGTGLRGQLNEWNTQSENQDVQVHFETLAAPDGYVMVVATKK